jgi:acyl-CoA thioesterase FadM
MIASLQCFDYRRPLVDDDIFGGHVNFARYYKFVGEAYHEWYTAVGINSGQHDRIVPFMVHGELDFLAEMHYPGQMICRLTVSRVGRSSLEHLVEIFDAGRMDQPCARGKFVNSCRSRTTLLGEAWPEDILALCWDGGAKEHGVPL